MAATKIQTTTVPRPHASEPPSRRGRHTLKNRRTRETQGTVPTLVYPGQAHYSYISSRSMEQRCERNVAHDVRCLDVRKMVSVLIVLALCMLNRMHSRPHQNHGSPATYTRRSPCDRQHQKRKRSSLLVTCLPASHPCLILSPRLQKMASSSPAADPAVMMPASSPAVAVQRGSRNPEPVALHGARSSSMNKPSGTKQCHNSDDPSPPSRLLPLLLSGWDEYCWITGGRAVMASPALARSSQWPRKKNIEATIDRVTSPKPPPPSR